MIDTNDNAGEGQNTGPIFADGTGTDLKANCGNENGKNFKGYFKEGDFKRTKKLLETFSKLVVADSALAEISDLLQSIIDVACSEDVRIWIQDEDGSFKILYTEPWKEQHIWEQLKKIRINPEEYDYLKPIMNGEIVLVQDICQVENQTDLMKTTKQPAFIAFPIKNGKTMVFSIGYPEPIPDELVNAVMENAKAIWHFIDSMFRRDNLFDTMKTIAITDILTGLFNKRALEENLGVISKIDTEQWIDVKTGKKAIVVMQADLDGLKAINDSLGHDLGDEIIKRIGRRVIKKIIETENKRMKRVHLKFPELPDYAPSMAAKAYRYGGDEFTIAIMLDRKSFDFERIKSMIGEDRLKKFLGTENATLKEIGKSLASKIRKGVRGVHSGIKEDLGMEIPQLDISFGIASYSGETEFIRLFKYADGLLYDAKKNKDRKRNDPENDSLAIVMENESGNA